MLLLADLHRLADGRNGVGVVGIFDPERGMLLLADLCLLLVLRVSLVNGGLVVGESLLLLHDELREVLRDGFEVRNCGLVLLLLRVRRRELLVTPLLVLRLGFRFPRAG